MITIAEKAKKGRSSNLGEIFSQNESCVTFTLKKEKKIK